MRLSIALLLVLSGCAAADRTPPAATAAAADHRLPWTAENLKTVGDKCHFPGITVETRGLQISGLSAIGEEPPDWKRWDCVEKRIQVPAHFVVVSG